MSAYDLGRFAESARFVRHYPEQNKVVQGFLLSIQIPTLIVAGEHDDLVPWSNNQFLADTMPNSVAHRLDAGHFAWEEAAGEYGRLVSEWIGGGYKTYAGASPTWGAREGADHLKIAIARGHGEIAFRLSA